MPRFHQVLSGIGPPVASTTAGIGAGPVRNSRRRTKFHEAARRELALLLLVHLSRPRRAICMQATGRPANASARRHPIGAEPVGDGMAFRVWAPDRSSVSVGFENGGDTPPSAPPSGAL